MKIRQLIDSKPKWQHEDPEVRLAYLRDKPDTEIIHQLARSDKDLEVRQAAIKLVSEPELLLELSTDDQAAAAIGERYAALKGEDLEHVDSITASLPTPILVGLATHSTSIDIRRKAAEEIRDESILESVLLAPNHSRVHQHCAAMLTDKERLERINEHFLDKDKNVSRIIRSALQQIKHEEEDQKTRQQELEKVLAGAEKLATQEYSDEFPRHLEVLSNKWVALKSSDDIAIAPEMAGRIESALSAAEQLAREVPEKLALARSNAEQLSQQLQELSEGLKVSTEALPEIDGKVQAVRHAWPVGHPLDDFYRLAEPLEQLYGCYTQWQAAMKAKPQAQLEKLKQLHWPEDYARPIEIDESIEALGKAAQEQAEASAKQQEIIEQHNAQLDVLEQQLKDGNLKKAGKLIHTLQESQQAEKGLPKNIQQRLQTLNQKYIELKDWQGFVTNPKREELCQQMETLATDLTIPPQEKAVAIKELQEQWKKLGPSDSRQGQKLWNKFKKAGDEAFKPCAEYFAEQRNVREKNQEERLKICESLETFASTTDWDNADWKAVQHLVNTARNEWRKYDNIPRSARKKLQTRYEAAMESVQQHLREEQSRNHDIKAGLIEQLKVAREEGTAIPERIQLAKKLQADWKNVGFTARKVDQKLWKKFRKECDDVFSAREETKKAERAEQNEKVTAAQSLIADYDKKLSSDNFGKHDLQNFKKQFSDMDLPREARQVAKDFEQRQALGRKRLKELAQQSEQIKLREFKRRAGLLAKLEKGELTADAVESDWSGDIELDQDLEKILEQRKNANPAPHEAAEQLVIRAEILAGVDSPVESQQARMAYQVERLNRELSRGEKETRSVPEQFKELLVLWYQQPVNDDTLIHRFEKCEGILEK